MQPDVVSALLRVGSVQWNGIPVAYVAVLGPVERHPCRVCGGAGAGWTAVPGHVHVHQVGDDEGASRLSTAIRS
jgi:hypothetical protein